jgi:hypothetical protein
MSMTFSPPQLGCWTAVMVALGALGACSGPPTSKEAGELGYGTPGVSTYQPGSSAATLQEELDRCSRVPQAGAASQTRGFPAACAQLQRTLHNQPGNTLQSVRTP